MEERFYSCDICGNLLLAAVASGVTPHCCGEEMTLLKPNEAEGNAEKHLPVVERVGECALKISVGSQLHPMTKEHNIKFVCVETDIGMVIRYLDVGESPDVVVKCNGKPKAVYAYCNIHGLWRKEL